jgi:excisionase family DNA binding protein
VIDADLPEWISTGQAAAILNVSRETVRERLKSGEIAFRKPRVHSQVNLASLLEYRDQHQRPSDPTDYTNEKWLPVVGYEGFYMVSDHGRVRNCKPAQRILRHKIDEKGYHRLALYRRGNPKRHARVHRLVLEAFIGPCPENREACHADCDTHNNELSNLRWDTHPENMMDSARMGRLISQVNGGIGGRARTDFSELHCSRGHPRTVWNTAIRCRATGHSRCVACERARASVNKALRNGRPTPSIDVVADQRFRALQAEHEGRQAA